MSFAARHLWTVSAGAALVVGAWWLRTPGIRYLEAAAGATVLAAIAAVLLSRNARPWALAALAAMLAFGALAFRAQEALARAEADWPAYRNELAASGTQALASELSATARELRSLAERALDAPADEAGAFRALARAVRGTPERGIVLYRDGQPSAWGGRFVSSPDTLVAPLGATFSTFYVSLYAAAVRGNVRAVAAAVVHAEPPGDSLVPAVANIVAHRVGLHGFDVAPVRAGVSRAGAMIFAPAGDTLFMARPIPPGEEEARLTALESARSSGTLILAVALLLFLGAAWRNERSLGWRLVPLGVALGAVALAPLSTLSSASLVFDPTVYYSPLGGALTANVAALAMAAAILSLALLIVLRARVRLRSRRVALVAVLVIAAASPVVLRAVSAGVAPPPGGVPDQLWIAWEVALFLVASALLVAAAAAGGTLVGQRRGLPPVVAPLIALAAAIAAPLVLDASGGWPSWYMGLWIVAIAALALTRAHRRLVVSAAAVAALGATTLTWSAGVRGRMALADRDVSSLGVVQPDVVAVLQRMGDALDDAPAPASSAELVRTYMASDLVGSGYPVALQSWTAQDSLGAQVLIDPLALPDSGIHALVVQARSTCERVVRAVPGVPGMLAVLAVPQSNGDVTTVIVAPRTRLIPQDPFHALLGLEAREQGPAPYSVALAALDPELRLAPGQTRWYLSGSELHGDHLVRTAAGPMRTHIEIELRSLASLVPRGTLIVLVDALVILLLWALSVFPEGALPRLLRSRARRWRSSYRARVTVVLFGFFVIPAAAFALWSYRRLQTEDRQTRAILVREMLRGAVGGGVSAHALLATGDRSGTPVLVYRDGELRESSHPLVEALAPAGWFIPPDVQRALHGGREVFSARIIPVGGAQALFGYLTTLGESGEPVVAAAPSRGSDATLDQRRRDLGVLVVFATALGAIAAFWLSRAASRTLAQPIGRLRGAALAIAGGEREPPLSGEPPEEFEPVFSAFRRMASDLGQSRTALESAQRRTAEVLRNVASGVVALTPAGVVLLANPRAEALLGRSLATGASVKDVDALAPRLASFLAGGPDEEEFELTLDGRQCQARLTRLAGGGAVLTLDDVTELARAQRVLAWGEMARQVAHEIKNPLTPIRLGVQHLKRAYAAQRSDFDEILERNARRILAEIDRLDEIARGFSRYGTAPEERLPAQQVDVAAIVRDVVDLERLGTGTVDWRLDGADSPLPALAREDELREVLLNVLENARQAGASRVEIRCGRRDGRVVLEVRDDGRGIPPAVLPRIFEPHFSTRTSGSGLGLAISRRLVESWGGAIAIASAEHEGTRVRIELSDHGSPE